MVYFHVLSNGDDSISFPYVMFCLLECQKCRKLIEMNNPRKKIAKGKNKTNQKTPVYIVFIYITMLNIEAQYAPAQQVYKAA